MSIKRPKSQLQPSLIVALWDYSILGLCRILVQCSTLEQISTLEHCRNY